MFKQPFILRTLAKLYPEDTLVKLSRDQDVTLDDKTYGSYSVLLRRTLEGTDSQVNLTVIPEQKSTRLLVLEGETLTDTYFTNDFASILSQTVATRDDQNGYFYIGTLGKFCGAPR